MGTGELSKWVAHAVARAVAPVSLRLLAHEVHRRMALTPHEARERLLEALADHPEVEAVGVECYGLLRRILEGATIRVRLEPIGLAFGFLRLYESEHFVVAYDAFHDPSATERPFHLEDANGSVARASLHHADGGQWHLRGLGRWLAAVGARPSDSVILWVVDGKDRRFRIELERASGGSPVALEGRNREVADLAAEVLDSLGPGAHLLFFVMRKLVARRAFHHPVPPEPLVDVLSSDERFDVDPAAGLVSCNAGAAKPPCSDPVRAILEQRMPERGYSKPQVRRAVSFWEATAAAMTPRVRKAEVWAAAVELSSLKLDAPGAVRASEVAESYGTSAAAASRRSREMLRRLRVSPEGPRLLARDERLRSTEDPFARVEERYAGRDQEPETGRDLEPVVLRCDRCRVDQTISEPYRFFKGGRRGVAGRCPRCSRPLLRYLEDDDRSTRDAEGSP